MYNFYCDESGNTGTNWTNQVQPYFVNGGWLIDAQSEQQIKEKLTKLFNEYQGPEIKSSILNTSKGMYYLDKSFSILLESGSLPFFVVADIEFMVAAKIVESFFDYEYNKSILPTFSYDKELRKNMASVMLQDREIIHKFSRVIKSLIPTKLELFEIQGLLVNLFKDCSCLSVANNISQLNEASLMDIIEEFNIVTCFGTKRNQICLNFPVLFFLMQLVNDFACVHQLTVNFCHDELRGYDSIFNELRSIIINKPPVRKLYYLDGSHVTITYPYIKTFNVNSSHNNVFLQMSDLLCGFITRCLKKIKTKCMLSQEEINALKIFIPLHDELYTWDYCAPYDFIQNFVAFGCGIKDIKHIGLSHVIQNVNDTFDRHIKH